MYIIAYFLSMGKRNKYSAQLKGGCGIDSEIANAAGRFEINGYRLMFG